MNLQELWKQWIDLHDQILLNPPITKKPVCLAAPFFSVPDVSEERSRRRPILMVGKATRDCWHLEEYNDAKLKSIEQIEQRISVRLERTHAFLKCKIGQRTDRSAFWRFWINLRNRTGAPVIWTNLAKIGVQKGNPPYPYLKAQEDLSRNTLNAEIEHYKPALVILVTDFFGRDEIVCPVFEVNRECIEDAEDGYWSREHYSVRPAVLWTSHPQVKPKEMVSAWLDKASALYKATL